MKKSDKLSKNEVDKASLDSNKKLLGILKGNKKLLDKAISLKKSSNLTDKNFLRLIKENIPIPISIFKNSSPLESLVKYLKDNLGLSLHEIASLLNRDQRTIWITYSNAIKKITQLDTTSKINVPIEIFADRKFSALENLISYLVDEFGISLSKISDLLNRDYKTIWTIYSRSKKKGGLN